jgi:hypothetical protein
MLTRPLHQQLAEVAHDAPGFIIVNAQLGSFTDAPHQPPRECLCLALVTARVTAFSVQGGQG